MATKKVKTEVETLEQYRVALENVQNQPEISTIMTEFGYDNETLSIGQSLFTETRQAFDTNQTEDDETTAAYSAFTATKNQLAATYALHRKKAKVIFRNDALSADKLKITGSMPQAYVKWLETVKKFYSVALADSDIQAKLVRLKITADGLNAANTLITALETERSEYLKEKGESQDATKAKDASFARLDDWMSEFYSVAKIALEDKPQLIEALSLLVRS